MIDFELHSSQTPAVVLEALHAHGGEWRESVIPRELRDLGIMAVECRVKGTICTLTYRRSWYGAGARGQLLRGRATVETGGDGTKIRVSVGKSLPEIRFTALGLVLGMPMLFALFGVAALWFLLLTSLVLVVVNLLVYAWLQSDNGTLSRGEPEVDYLLRRIEEAVAHAGSAQPFEGRTATEV